MSKETARRHSPGPAAGAGVHNHTRNVTIQRPAAGLQLLRLGPSTVINLASVAGFELLSYPVPHVLVTLITGKTMYYDGDQSQVLRRWLDGQAAWDGPEPTFDEPRSVLQLMRDDGV